MAERERGGHIRATARRHTQEVTIILAALAIPVAALIGLMLMQLLEDVLLPAPTDSRKPDATEPEPTPADLAAPAPVAAPPTLVHAVPAPPRPYASGRGRPAGRRSPSCTRVAASGTSPWCSAPRTRHQVTRSA
ncbi:hypothetical protein GCM10020220_009390 [Nonomuraea rubra]